MSENLVTVKEGGVSSENNTYIVSSGLIGEPSDAQYTICPATKNICQVNCPYKQ